MPCRCIHNDSQPWKCEQRLCGPEDERRERDASVIDKNGARVDLVAQGRCGVWHSLPPSLCPAGCNGRGRCTGTAGWPLLKRASEDGGGGLFRITSP